jgi:hypothetical protein
MPIPTEPIGSIPRPAPLLAAMIDLATWAPTDVICRQKPGIRARTLCPGQRAAYTHATRTVDTLVSEWPSLPERVNLFVGDEEQAKKGKRVRGIR